MKADTDAVGPDDNLILTDTIAEANMTPTETIPGHATGTADATTEVLPGTHTPMPIHIALAKTPHIGDHLHTEAPAHSSRLQSQSAYKPARKTLHHNSS